MSERFTNANLFNAFVREAVAMGLREKLVAANPELRAVVESPLLKTAMVPGRVCDALYQAVVDARGRPALRRIAHAGMRDHGGPLLKGLFENTRALFGGSPEALFSQTQTIIGPIIRNIEVTWAAEGRRPHHPAAGRARAAVWEGYFEYFSGLVSDLAGSAGPAGATGPQGPPGNNGTNGTNGIDGAPGATGPTGPQGASGVPGPKGDTGPMGSQGAVGPTGPQGATGPMGLPGASGAVGATGPIGLQGPRGGTGPAGPAGATGASGVGLFPGAMILVPQGVTVPAGFTCAAQNVRFRHDDESDVDHHREIADDDATRWFRLCSKN